MLHKFTAHEIMRMHLVGELYNRRAGLFDKEDEILAKYEVKTPPAVAPALVQPPENVIKLSTVIDELCAFKIKLGKWTERTPEENRRKYESLVFYLGDVDIKSIGTKEAERMFDHLRKMPARRTNKKYAGMTVDQLAAMEHDSKLSVRTVNIILELATGLFNFAESRGYVDRNPFKGMRMRDKEKAEDKRHPFTPEDLRVIFARDSYLKYSEGEPALFWLPILGL